MFGEVSIRVSIWRRRVAGGAAGVGPAGAGARLLVAGRGRLRLAARRVRVAALAGLLARARAARAAAPGAHAAAAAGTAIPRAFRVRLNNYDRISMREKPRFNSRCIKNLRY